MSADRLSGVTLRAHNTPPDLWTFTLYLHKLADLGPVTGPVLLTLTETSSGDSRAGTIETCTVRGTALVCK